MSAAPVRVGPAKLTRAEIRRRYSDPRRIVVTAVGVAVAIAVVGVIPSYQAYIWCLVALYVLPTFGLRVLVGMTGQLSIAQGAFVGIGAYAYVILVVRHGVNPLLAIIAAVVVSVLLGAILAIPASRVSGFYLALVTLGFQYIFQQVASQFPSFTGGSSGLSVPPLRLFGTTMTSLNITDTAIVLVAVLWWLGLQFASSRYGHAMVAVRDNENAASAVGISARRYKVLAFMISAGCGALAGPFIAITLGYIDPTQYSFLLSVQLLVAVFIGGTGGWFGIAVASFVVFGLPQYLNSVATYQEVIFNGLLLVIVLIYPRGLAGPIEWVRAQAVALWPRWRGSRPRRQVQNPDTGADSDSERGPDPTGRCDMTTRAADGAAVLLETDDVVLRFGGITALDGISLRVAAGMVHGLVGPNGSGKSSLLNVLTRFYQPSSGSVRFDGRSVLRTERHRLVGLGMARTFQGAQLFEGLSVREHVMIGFHLRARSSMLAGVLGLPQAIRDRHRCAVDADELLAFVGLADRADELATDLPYGQQRLLEIARALAGRPRVILLDEPGAGMSPAERSVLADILRKVRAERGASIVLVEHDLDMVMSICDVVTVLHNGRLLVEGTPAQVRDNAEFVQVYLGGSA